MSKSKEEAIFKKLRQGLLDPLASELANQLQWWELKELSKEKSDIYPIAIIGKGSPLLLLHGFDSSFLEFRRLVPYLKEHHQLFIPDLFGFGFCPRPKNANYDKNSLLLHLKIIISQIPSNQSIGVIGASMGGAVALELAKILPKKINRILLLAPAGLTEPPKPIPPILDKVGVWFLSQQFVRKSLCRQAFADPNKSVGKAEEQIASLHLQIPGWNSSLAAFARNGGFSCSMNSLPSQPLHSIWGVNDRIITSKLKKQSICLLKPNVEEFTNCGHLPHLDQPKKVANRWLSLNKEKFLNVKRIFKG